jgi:hypothetical protein
MAADAERARQVGGTDREQVDTVDGGDLLDLLDRLMSWIMQASSNSLFDRAMCSKSGVLPKLAARLPAAMPRSPSGG